MNKAQLGIVQQLVVCKLKIGQLALLELTLSQILCWLYFTLY